MPIYAYRCERCGHAQDVIQKFSDAPLTECPACGADAYRKQLTAPSFQLKGSGWYVTDFRDGGKKPAAAAKADAAAEGATGSAEKAAEPTATPPVAGAAAESKPSPASPAPSPSEA